MVEPVFAGVLNRGCLKPRQIIKATVDHCNARKPSPPLIPSFCAETKRRLQSQPRQGQQAIATIFVKVIPVARNPSREENGRNSQISAPAQYEQSSWSGLSGLWFKMVPQGYTMASGAIMERSADNRATMAAGGTAMALRQWPADAIVSGTTHSPGSWRRGTSLALRLAAAGGKRNNAQQNADRRLPPGGNTGCRSPR